MSKPVKSNLTDLIENLSTKNLDSRGILANLDRSQKLLQSEEVKQECVDPTLILNKKIFYKSTHDYLPISSPQLPQVTLAVRLISDLYSNIRIEHLPPLLKQLLYQIRLPMVRLGLFEIKRLFEPMSPPLELVKLLLSYEYLWKNESALGFPTYSKLSRRLVCSNIETVDLYQHFKSILAPASQIYKGQSKRATIFEKRLLETEQSKIKTVQANLLAKQLIKTFNNELAKCHVINDFLITYWHKLLVLEFLRRDPQAFYSTIIVMTQLVKSITPPKTNKQLTSMLESSWELGEALLAGLGRLSVEENTLNEQVAVIESTQLSVIESAKLLTSDEAVDLPANSSKVKNKNDITRLNTCNIFKPIGDPSTNNSSRKTITSLELIDFAEFALNHLDEIAKEVDLDVFASNFLPKPSNEAWLITEKIQTQFGLTEGTWCCFTLEEQTNKLLTIDKSDNEYIFIDKNIKIVHRLDARELLSRLNDGHIFVAEQQASVEKIIRDILTDQSLAQTLILSLPPSKQTLNEKIRNAASPNGGKRSIPENNDNKNNNDSHTSSPDRITRKVNPKKVNPKTEPQLNELNLTKNLTPLVVGSWVTLAIEGKMQKCKLAAKLVSKDAYIFVDRQGEKVLQLKAKELNRLNNSGKIGISDSADVREDLLESVISKTRELKKEKQINEPR